MPLAVLRRGFDDPDWIFELKYDGFRALAYLDNGTCRLVSRYGNGFTRFRELAASIAAAVPGQVVLDGEVVHLGPDGDPQFYDLMRRRIPQHLYAFDLLWLNGKDLRQQPLLLRKRMLREIVPARETGTQLLYADHVQRAHSAIHLCMRPRSGRHRCETRGWALYAGRDFLGEDQEPEVLAERRPAGAVR